jgi:hypothetical protein
MTGGKVEYWVVRVICPALLPGQSVSTVERIDRVAALWHVVRGRYQVVGKEICEPIECFAGLDAQPLAIERAAREHAKTGCVHKVTMVAYVED